LEYGGYNSAGIAAALPCKALIQLVGTIFLECRQPVYRCKVWIVEKTSAIA